MTDELRILAALQSLDARILAARAELARIPREIERLDAERAGQQQALAGATARREASAKLRREMELEVEAQNAAIRRLQTQQAQVKTNREYTAMLHEIDGAKRAISDLEEKILLEMEHGDALAAAERESLAACGAACGRIGREQDLLRAGAAEVGAALAAADAERQAALGGLPREALAVYQRVFQGRAGLAVVPVENGACGGCGAPLPPQTVNEVRKMEALITCETCGRILVWRQEPT